MKNVDVGGGKQMSNLKKVQGGVRKGEAIVFVGGSSIRYTKSDDKIKSIQKENK